GCGRAVYPFGTPWRAMGDRRTFAQSVAVAKSAGPSRRAVASGGNSVSDCAATLEAARRCRDPPNSPGGAGPRSCVGRDLRVRPGAVVADLFAGIGYFTLPLAMRAHPAIVYACELNPISFQYLVRNIRLNRATNVVPLLGDCRDVMPRGVADWVIMGHFDAREYLDVAFAVLRTRGTIVYHELCPKEQFPDALARRLAAATRANWRNVTQMHTRIVKSYAPGI